MDLLTDLADLWKRCHWPETKGLRIISLRGCKVVDGKLVKLKEVLDRFDDTMFFFDLETGYINHAPCTAGQPGWRSIQQYGIGHGAPFTRPGCYRYIRGMHLGKYRALRQSNDKFGVIAAIRDVNKNGTPEFAVDSPDKFSYVPVAINIHATTGNPVSVGLWSSGCHVITGDWGDDKWQMVYNLTYNIYGRQPYFNYAVAPAIWLDDHADRTLWGSVGPRTAQLSAFLDEKGIKAYPAGGTFLESLDRGYRTWQRKSGQVQTGVCSNPPWSQ